MSRTEDALLSMTGSGQRMHDAFLAVVDDEALVSNIAITTLISLHRDGPVRPNEITEVTGVTSGGATKLIDRLERGGLVVREKGAVLADGRAVVVSLTDFGTETAERIVVAAQPHVDALIGGLIAMWAGADSPTV